MEPTEQPPAADEPTSEVVPVPNAVEDHSPTSQWLLLGTTTLLLVIASFLLEPMLEWWFTPRAFASHWQHVHGWDELFVRRVFQGFSVLWFFVLGASFGSFLHCVEYRLPRGISIVARGSACPHCGTHIKAWHNVPVFGWLMLGGRCAACRWPIPVRYAWWEVVFGLVFVLLMGAELIAAGVNLPYAGPWFRFGSMESLWFPNIALISQYVHHAVLFVLLLTACLFAVDGFRMPRSLYGVALVVIVLDIFLAPRAWGLTSHHHVMLSPAVATPSNAALASLLGALAGVALGTILTRRSPRNWLSGDASSTLFAAVLVGGFAGWQLLLVTVGLTLVLRTLLVVTPGRRAPQVNVITSAALVAVLTWRFWWLALVPWLSVPSSNLALVALPVVCLVWSLGLDYAESAMGFVGILPTNERESIP